MGRSDYDCDGFVVQLVRGAGRAPGGASRVARRTGGERPYVNVAVAGAI